MNHVSSAHFPILLAYRLLTFSDINKVLNLQNKKHILNQDQQNK